MVVLSKQLPKGIAAGTDFLFFCMHAQNTFLCNKNPHSHIIDAHIHTYRGGIVHKDFDQITSTSLPAQVFYHSIVKH